MLTKQIKLEKQKKVLAKVKSPKMLQPVVRQVCANCFGKMKVEGCPLKESKLTAAHYEEDLLIELKRCSGCKVLSYCSKSCQMEHWHYGHKKICKVLSGKQTGPWVQHDVKNCLSCTEENQGARCKSLESYQAILANYWRYFDCEQGPGTQFQCPFIPGECTRIFHGWVDNYLYIITDLLQEAVTGAGSVYYRNAKAVKSYQLIRDNFLLLRSRYWSFCTQASGKNKNVADLKLAELAFARMMKSNYLSEEDREPRNAMIVLNNVFKGRSKSLIWEKFIHFTGKFYRILRILKYSVINFRNLPDKKKKKYSELININKEHISASEIEQKRGPLQVFSTLPDSAKCFGCQRRFGGRKAQEQVQFMGLSWFCTKEEDSGHYIHVRFPDKPILYDNGLVSCGDREDCIRRVVSLQMRGYEHQGGLLHEFLSHSLLCSGCIKYSNKTHKCSRCRAVIYCSQDCLNTDWESHKTVCRSGAEGDSSSNSRGLMERSRLQGDLKVAYQEHAMSVIAYFDPLLYTGMLLVGDKHLHLAGLDLD